MEICWNAGTNEKATKLLEECGWTVCTGPCDVPVQVTSEGSGFLVKGPGSASQNCADIAAAMAYINEDILQAEVAKPSGGARPDLDTFEGCMVGIGIGDMVGLGVEGFPMPLCTQYTDQIRPEGGLTQTQGPWETGARMQAQGIDRKEDRGPLDLSELFESTADEFVPATLDDKGSCRFPYGQISDDTQCSRELSDSIIAAGRFSVQAFTDKLTHLHSTIGVIGQGPTSRATLDKLADGASWFEGSDEKPDALTNGSIMRVGPVGLLAWADPTSQSAWANGVLSSHVTHQASLCKEGCSALGVAVAAAVAAKVAGADPVSAVLDALGETCPYTDYRGMLASMLQAGPELQPAVDAMHAAVPQNELFKTQGHDGGGRYNHGEITMFPPHSAGFAIYGFLRTPDDFWESIFACIQVGGDTDTVAAMCGALAGAYAGYEKIASARPDAGHVLNAIQDSADPGTADVPALRKLAKGLYDVAVGPAPKL